MEQKIKDMPLDEFIEALEMTELTGDPKHVVDLSLSSGMKMKPNGHGGTLFYADDED